MIILALLLSLAYAQVVLVVNKTYHDNDIPIAKYRAIALDTVSGYPSPAVANSWDPTWSTTSIGISFAGLKYGDPMAMNLVVGRTYYDIASPATKYLATAFDTLRGYPTVAIADSWDPTWRTTSIGISFAGLKIGDPLAMRESTTITRPKTTTTTTRPKTTTTTTRPKTTTTTTRPRTTTTSTRPRTTTTTTRPKTTTTTTTTRPKTTTTTTASASPSGTSTVCVTTGTSGANSLGQVLSTLTPCTGYLWQPIAWDPQSRIATGYAVTKLITYSDESFKGDANGTYWSGNMISETFDHSPLPSWPTWDGTNFDKNNQSYVRSSALRDAVCSRVSGQYVIKGMYNAFPNPFLNNLKPTLAEVDNYHFQVLKHLRRIMNIPKSTTFDGWYHHRHFWFSKVEFNNPDNICATATRGHCGYNNMMYKNVSQMDAFIARNPGIKCPDGAGFCSSPYSQTTDSYGSSVGASGSSPNVKLTHPFQNTLCMFLSEGLTSTFTGYGHNGPIFGRPHFSVILSDTKVNVIWGGSSSAP
jgi:hypothetical protein